MLSARLKAIVEALPLKPGLRVLEIGCGPSAASREVAARVGSGYVLGIDRSARWTDVIPSWNAVLASGSVTR